MKRIAFIIFLSVTFVNSLFAQVPQDMIGFDAGENGSYSILKSDIDSIVYSDYDMDSVSYAPNKKTQVIYTKRGIYRAPLSNISYIGGIGNNTNEEFIKVNLTSSDAYEIEANSTKVNCNFESNQFNNCRYGIVYSLSTNPTTSNFASESTNYLNESTSATFTLSLPLQNYKYYYRPYVIANNHTYYGVVKSFNTKAFRDAKIGWTEFYKSANGEKWKDNRNWCSEYPLLDDFHRWYGMRDEFGGTALHLNANNVTGNLYLNELDFNALYLHDNNINSITIDNCLSSCSRGGSNKEWEYTSRFTLDQNKIPVSINMKKSYLAGGIFISARNTSCKDININDCWFDSSSSKKEREYNNHGLQIYTQSINNLNIENCQYLSDIQGNRMGNYYAMPMGPQDYFPSEDDQKRVEVNNMTIANTTFTSFHPHISGLLDAYSPIIRGFNIKNLTFKGINETLTFEDTKIGYFKLFVPLGVMENDLYLSFVQLDIKKNAEVDTLHFIGESTEHAIHFISPSYGFNLKKLIFENVFEGDIRSGSNVPLNIESISYINVNRLRNKFSSNIENVKDIYIKQCKFYDLPHTETNAIYHITNSVYRNKINGKWYDVGITNFVGTKEQFIKTYGNRRY